MFSFRYADADASLFYNGFFVLGYVENGLGLVSAWTVLIATFKFVSLFRHNLKVKRLLYLFHLIGQDCPAIVMQILFVYVAYSVVGTVLFGAVMVDFRDVSSTFTTLFTASLGKFDFYKWTLVGGTVAQLYFISFVVVNVIMLLNLFVAILSSAMITMQNDFMQSEEHVRLDVWMYLIVEFQLLVGIGDGRNFHDVVEESSKPLMVHVKEVDKGFATLENQLLSVLERARHIVALGELMEQFDAGKVEEEGEQRKAEVNQKATADVVASISELASRPAPPKALLDLGSKTQPQHTLSTPISNEEAIETATHDQKTADLMLWIEEERQRESHEHMIRNRLEKKGISTTSARLVKRHSSANADLDLDLAMLELARATGEAEESQKLMDLERINHKRVSEMRIQDRLKRHPNCGDV